MENLIILLFNMCDASNSALNRLIATSIIIQTQFSSQKTDHNKEKVIAKFLIALVTATPILIVPQAYSRDTLHYPLNKNAIQSAGFKKKKNSSIRFYFDDLKHPKAQLFHCRFSSNKKTNIFNKTADAACQWVLIYTLLSIQDRVRAKGGNAVIERSSYYKKQTYSKTSKVECHANALIASATRSEEVV
jgi:hypothetical protein